MYSEPGFTYDPGDDIIFWHRPLLAQSNRTGARKAVAERQVEAVLFVSNVDADALPPEIRSFLRDYAQVSVPDDVEDMLAFVRATVPFISGHIEAGRRVLVHCSYGRNRSSLAVLAYLWMVEGRGRALLRVLEEVRRVNPDVTIHGPNVVRLAGLSAGSPGPAWEEAVWRVTDGF